MNQPPAYSQSQTPPPAGNRVPALSTQPWPHPNLTGPAPFQDADGSPLWVVSALMGDSVQPAKAGPHLPHFCRVPYGGQELMHEGRYDVLPITPDMEWVPTHSGQTPKGRRPVEGGFEEGGQHLFHAAITVNGLRVPGKTGEHLGGAHCAFGGGEHIEREHYEILCWR